MTKDNCYVEDRVIEAIRELIRESKNEYNSEGSIYTPCCGKLNESFKMTSYQFDYEKRNSKYGEHWHVSKSSSPRVNIEPPWLDYTHFSHPFSGWHGIHGGCSQALESFVPKTDILGWSAAKDPTPFILIEIKKPGIFTPDENETEYRDWYFNSILVEGELFQEVECKLFQGIDDKSCLVSKFEGKLYTDLMRLILIKEQMDCHCYSLVLFDKEISKENKLNFELYIVYILKKFNNFSGYHITNSNNGNCDVYRIRKENTDRFNLIKIGSSGYGFTHKESCYEAFLIRIK